MTAIRPLSFKDVDALGFAAGSDLDVTLLPGPYAATSLGPLLELLHLEDAGRLPRRQQGGWLANAGATPLVAALYQEREWWLSPETRRMGFIRSRRNSVDGDARFDSFLIDAQTAARNIARLPGSTPGMLVAAMAEMESNIHEHSDAVDTGLLAFRATPGIFEFVAADRGVGVLSSLRRCPEFVSLADHGKALRTALTDGASRHGSKSDHGHGFRQIFIGLANLQSALRFRSGDHALTIDGVSPELTTAHLAQKPEIDGFFVSVRCQANPRSTQTEGNV